MKLFLVATYVHPTLDNARKALEEFRATGSRQALNLLQLLVKHGKIRLKDLGLTRKEYSGFSRRVALAEAVPLLTSVRAEGTCYELYKLKLHLRRCGLRLTDKDLGLTADERAALKATVA